MTALTILAAWCVVSALVGLLWAAACGGADFGEDYDDDWGVRR